VHLLAGKNLNFANLPIGPFAHFFFCFFEYGSYYISEVIIIALESVDLEDSSANPGPESFFST
jgi:hypothetical protein